MATTVTTSAEGKTWGGGNEPMNASYGKMMMWFFIVSDALTFSGFLAAYGFSRFKFIQTWPLADEVFTHFPFMHGVSAPMYYVAFMTFVLIFSSVTMVLAVDAGHQMKKDKVIIYMFLTIVGGFIFVGSQAWEWKNFIKGEYGAVETKGGSILQFEKIDKEHSTADNIVYKRVALAEFAADIPSERTEDTKSKGIWFFGDETLPSYSITEVKEGFKAHSDILIRTEAIDPKTKTKITLSREESLKRIEDTKYVVEGANLIRNEYGQKLFADFFFFITGFHGFHVLSGVIINVLIFFNVLLGTYDKRKTYEMVEKVGLYWHFVDLVWVFVFTFFYLV
ncbi:cytochrome oxidase subunit III [Flavobacterium psychrophilum]|uniref:Cytochrome c oxidase family protein n=3 Tax=Flavobacterium psychrophilum TaxID=96345 RepID=A6H1E6_FLAPJ|nr:cytochrome c oxidase subunit 3 [Flavobacterium psychrophilum]AIG30853.1 cytochrome oxidase subunit III [Flavobacterium psychrophilum]AIG33126.1 cytochrome oxidase subunit III [Flavobacterium psychrophilum]AIG35283.1 cytochrome oxidase subunit III [Flavobacterium psychrophilum]AIG37647.1 cytochrome oxidase subunit III [Flavobacterium psychrophilum]AIG39912.1 cytochrome oxidase subunit III [Flavobacterium psychrophilum]